MMQTLPPHYRPPPPPGPSDDDETPTLWNGDIAELYAKLNLTEDEEVAINLEDVIDDEIEQKANLSLVGKLLTKKPYNLIHMKNALSSAWRLAKGFSIKEIGDNLFVCEFKTKTDRTRILNEAPWHFDKQLILFEPLCGNLQPDEVGLEKSPFWIRIYNIPLNCRSKAAITRIASKVGRIVEWSDEEMATWGRYSRIRVMIDVTKPIVRGTKIINPLGESCWVSFKYEKIQNFCYWCGMCDHIVADCETKPEEMEVEEWPYGPVLRATPKNVV
ncbi:uncharacterized protein LOC126672803 [Mercurialis annua]|uniref:uncharacterized protein LOC126672803 n=1 Tax=Mercurialis annua TaxID=3986 RepID=UPI002160387D|nr:uncharacterized protein LOC126672803 [Mercurialis annua]